MYKSIDLFAGIGGIRMGFEQAFREGPETVFISEINAQAQETYRVNFGDSVKITGDITRVNPADIPDADILLGGFPCQPFSKAGRQEGFDDTRGTLFFNILEILKAKRPHVFFLENVKNLKSHDHGNTFKVIQDSLLNLNYTFDYAVLSASDFGVPQRRERIYMVGFDREYFNIPENFHFIFPEPQNIPTSLKNILLPSVPDKYTLSDAGWQGAINHKEDQKRKGNGFHYNLYDPDNTPNVVTLTAHYMKGGSEILIQQDGKNPRKLTPRECARLQGFPNSFRIPVSDSMAYKQFGNSVAVPVVRAVAKEIERVMEKFMEEKKSTAPQLTPEEQYVAKK